MNKDFLCANSIGFLIIDVQTIQLQYIMCSCNSLTYFWVASDEFPVRIPKKKHVSTFLAEEAVLVYSGVGSALITHYLAWSLVLTM